MAQYAFQKGLWRTPRDNRLAVSLMVFLIGVLLASLIIGIVYLGA